MYDTPVEVKVYGEAACFTRPEMKVERVSYPVITPSAARGVLEAIYWKPEFAYSIREILVLSPIKYFSILRNEVNTRASERAARGWETSGGGFFASDDRAQRNTLGLKDVSYIIRADIRIKSGINEDAAKYRDQFRRRVTKGQCYAHPYLGCREFTAFFSEPTESDSPDPSFDMDLGRMLLDMDFVPGKQGKAVPRFFNAEIRGGILKVNSRPGGNDAP